DVSHLGHLPGARAWENSPPAPSSWRLEGSSSPGPRLIRGGVDRRERAGGGRGEPPKKVCQRCAYLVENGTLRRTLGGGSRRRKHWRDRKSVGEGQSSDGSGAAVYR